MIRIRYERIIFYFEFAEVIYDTIQINVLLLKSLRTELDPNTNYLFPLHHMFVGVNHSTSLGFPVLLPSFHDAAVSCPLEYLDVLRYKNM